MKRTGEKNKLTDAQREYIVERLAAFELPEAVARGLAQDFGVHVSRQAITRYDPTRSSKCPERWKQLFVATRQKIIDAKATRGAAAAIMRARSREKVMLSAVEKMAERVVRRAVRDADATVAKRPPKLTDAERARTLIAYVAQINALVRGGHPIDPAERRRAREVAAMLRRIDQRHAETTGQAPSRDMQAMIADLERVDAQGAESS
jgi:hypothetical protein